MTTTPDSPAAELRQAAKLMRERATAATPGPWERPLDTRYKNFVMAALPEGEQGEWIDGVIPASFSSHGGPAGRYAGQRERCSVVSCSTWSDGSFARKRSGRDLEYVASMHPGVAMAVADWLDDMAATLEEVPSGCFSATDPKPALAVARAYVGVTRGA